MRPPSFIAVSLQADGTGKVLASGNAAQCQLAAAAENAKSPGNWCAVYSGLGYHICGAPTPPAESARRLAAQAATVDGLSNRISALLSRRDQANRDLVRLQNSGAPSEGKTKETAKIDSELKKIAGEIQSTETAHAEAVEKSLKDQRDRNEKAADDFAAMIESQGNPAEEKKTPPKKSKRKGGK